MPVAALVNQHSIHRYSQVSAMIEIEAPCEILVCFSFSAVLSNERSRPAVQQFSRAVDRALIELFLQHGAFVGRVRGSDQIAAFGNHYDWLQRRHARRISMG